MATFTSFSRPLLETLYSALSAHLTSSAEMADITAGSVVLVVDQQMPRAMWQVGTVRMVIPGVDGRVRTAVVQVKDRTHTRPVACLIRLPALPQDSADT